MSAKGTQTIGTAYNGTLRLVISDDGGYGPASPGLAVSATACGGAAAISYIGEYLGGYYDSEVVWGGSPPSDPDAQAAVEAWVIGYGGPCDFQAAIWDVSASAVEDVDHTYVVNGAAGPPDELEFMGPTEIEVNWTIGLTGAYRRAEITETLPSGYAYLRDPRQRTGVGKWYADENTTVVVTCGNSSIEANYGEVGEVDIDIAIGLAIGIAYNTAPDIHTAYGEVSANSGDGPLGIPLAAWTFYKDTDSSTWHWHGSTYEPGYTAPPVDANTYWKTVPSGNSVTIHRCAGASSGPVDWSDYGIPAGRRVAPRLWKQNKGGLGSESYYQYSEYDDTEGHPFDLGLYRHYLSACTRQTEADVSVAPLFSGYYEYIEWITGYGPAVPEDISRVFESVWDGFECKIRADWLKQNNEIGAGVLFTNPVSMNDLDYDSIINLRVPLTFHDLVTPLADSPFRNDWMDLAREGLDLDTPPGTDDVRPSEWIAQTGMTVATDTWTMTATIGSVKRTLATRRRNRYRRISAHLWTGDPCDVQQEVTYLWLIATRANLPIETTLDDARWWDPLLTPWPGDDPGVAIEDVTDYNAFSCLKLYVTGGSSSIRCTISLQYREPANFNAPWYTSGEWNFGASGEGQATLSSVKEATVVGTWDSHDAAYVFDLAPDAGSEPWDLFLVESVEFFFEADVDTEFTFNGYGTVPYAVGTDEVMHRIAHRSSDYFGGRVWVDGMPNYKPQYGYTLDTERVEVGFKHTQDRQHDPDYEGEPQDLRSLKSLYEFYGEMVAAQVLQTATWEQDAVDESTLDDDDNSIGTPVWADMDEDGFALHIGVDEDVTFPGTTLIYADFILQGGARGLAKASGVRQAGQEFTLYYSDDYGTTKTEIRTTETDAVGMYRTGAGREKSPRRYWLSAFSLGGFVNVEEVWYAVSTTGTGHLHLAYHPVSGELLVTECGFIPDATGQLRIRNGPGWSERVGVPIVTTDQTACTATNRSYGHLLVEGDGGGVYARTQTNLLGEWGAQRVLDTAEALTWPVAMEWDGRLYMAAKQSDGDVVCFRFDMAAPNERVAPATPSAIRPSDQECAPALGLFEDIWVLVAAVANNGDVYLCSSNDHGDSWTYQVTLTDAGLHPAMCALRTDLWLATYIADSYQGADGKCEVRKVTVRGDVWTASGVLGTFPCDAKRPALYIHPHTYQLTLLVPKGSEWAIAGATPGIVEYTSNDGGETWSDPVVHEVL